MYDNPEQDHVMHHMPYQGTQQSNEELQSVVHIGIWWVQGSGALLDIGTSILIQKRYYFTGSVNRGTFGDSKTHFYIVEMF